MNIISQEARKSQSAVKLARRKGKSVDSQSKFHSEICGVIYYGKNAMEFSPGNMCSFWAFEPEAKYFRAAAVGGVKRH